MGSGDHDPDEGWAGPPLPPEDRLWRHPSELGSGTPAAPSTAAATKPHSRSTFGWALAGGVVVAVVAVVALELLGTLPDTEVDTAQGTQATFTSLSRPAVSTLRSEAYDPPGIAWVSIDGSPVEVPGVVLDGAGHVLVSADALTPSSNLDAVSCEGHTSKRVRVVGVDDEQGVALLEVTAPGWTAAEITTIRPQAGEEIQLLTQTATGQQAVTGMVKASRSTLEFDAAAPLDRPAVVVDASGAVIALMGTRAGRTEPTPIADALRAARRLADRDAARSDRDTPTTTHR